RAMLLEKLAEPRVDGRGLRLDAVAVPLERSRVDVTLGGLARAEPASREPIEHLGIGARPPRRHAKRAAFRNRSTCSARSTPVSRVLRAHELLSTRVSPPRPGTDLGHKTNRES